MTILILKSKKIAKRETAIFEQFINNGTYVKDSSKLHLIYEFPKKKKIIDLIVSHGWHDSLSMASVGEIPVILVVTNEYDFSCIKPLLNIRKIIVTRYFYGIDFWNSAGANKLIKYIPTFDTSLVKKGVRFFRRPRVLFIPPLEDCKRIINFVLPTLNKLSKFSINIFLSKECEIFYSQLVNKHIQILDDLQIEDLKSYDIIICSEEWVPISMEHKVAVLLIGRKGFEGIVKENNISKLANEDFIGRIGGSILEDVPQKLLEYEILKYVNLTSREKLSIIESNYRQLEKINSEVDRNRFMSGVIFELLKLNSISKLVDSYDMNLKFHISSNILLEDDSKLSKIRIVNIRTNQELMLVSGRDRKYLVALKELVEINISALEVWQHTFINHLYKKNILVFEINNI